MSVDSKIFLHICGNCRIFCEGEWEKNIGSSGLFIRLISPNFAFDRNELIVPNDVGPSNLIVKYFIMGWEVKDDGKASVEHQLFTFGRSASATHQFIGFGPIVLTDKISATTEMSRPHKNVAALGVATLQSSATKTAAST